MDQREAVVQFLQANGPVLPIKIAKFLNLDTIFASAVLSEMVARKMMKITFASIGGSPLYYLPGQEPQMDEILGNSLGGREKQAWQLLKARMVVREKDLEPWERVAIKSLKDFAVQIDVNLDDGSVDSFWKHHLVSDDQAKLMITEIIEQNKPVPVQEVQTVVEAATVVQEIPKQIETPQVKQEIKVEPIQIITSKMEEELEEEIENSKLEDEEVLYEEEIIEEKNVIDGRFYKKALEFIKENRAEVLKEILIKKDKEIDFIVDIKTGFGKLRYLIKAKNKSSINELDISSAYGEGQLKRLPVILLVNGKLNKKASQLIETKMQGQLIIKQI